MRMRLIPQKTNDMASGGARPGAGRKRLENKRVQVSFLVKSETASYISAQAEKLGISKGAVIDRLAEVARCGKE